MLIFLTVVVSNLANASEPDLCAVYLGMITEQQTLPLLKHPLYSEDFVASQVWTREWVVGNISYLSNDHAFYAKDTDGFYVKAVVTETGDLLSDFRLKNGETRSHSMRGSELFNLIFKLFGKRIKRVVGYWQDFGNSESSNYQTYRNQVYRGWKRPTEAEQKSAALSTWTGSQALRHGYGKIEGFRTDYIFEGAGNFWRVLVFFGRD